MKTLLFCNFFVLGLFLSLPSYSQLVLITGNVINEKTGTGIGNVNVLESISGVGTITNLAGNFSLMLKPGKSEFVITHNGFKDYSKKMVLQKDTIIAVSLMQLVNIKSKSKTEEQQKTAEKSDQNK